MGPRIDDGGVVVYDVACERCHERTEDCDCPPGFPGAIDPDTIYGVRQNVKMRWRQFPMSRDDAEMTVCGRGKIRRKIGTSTVWKVRVKIGGQSYSSYSNFTKRRAKQWVEDKINEKITGRKNNGGARRNAQRADQASCIPQSGLRPLKLALTG